jgi:hypothetical protein
MDLSREWGFYIVSEIFDCLQLCRQQPGAGPPVAGDAVQARREPPRLDPAAARKGSGKMVNCLDIAAYGANDFEAVEALEKARRS